MECTLRPIDIQNGRQRYQCTRCQRIIAPPLTVRTVPRTRCHADPALIPPPRTTSPALPSFGRRLFNFTVALTKHVADGMKQRDRTEIEALLKICQACPLYNGTHCMHVKCGCMAGAEERFFNKLAWRSESCPVDKW